MMTRSEQHMRLLWVGAIAVLAWRVAALFFPHKAAVDPEVVRIASALLGLWFLACGLWAFRRSRGQASLLFAWYGVTAGIHWGGPVGFGSPEMQNLLLAAYVVVSMAASESLFLHLAFAFPTAFAATRRRLFIVLVYLPVLVGVLLFCLLLFAPSSFPLSVIAVFSLIGTVFSLVALGVWIARLITAGSAERRDRRLTLVVTGMIVGWLPYTIVSFGLSPWPGYEGLFNLAMGLIPAVLAAALAAPKSRSSG